MSLDSIARRYAKALLELGVEQDALEKFVDDLRGLGETVDESPALFHVLSDPTVSVEARKAIMLDVAQKLVVAPLVKNAVQLITEHGRASLFPRIARQLAEMADARAGKVSAEVSSAAQLSEAQYARLAIALEKVTGRKISLVKRVDPSLIGGVVARVGDLVYDGSVKSQLREIRLSLLPS